MLKDLAKKVLPSQVRQPLKRAFEKRLVKLLEASGYTVSQRNDFYSPLPSVNDLESHAVRWNRPSGLQGIRFNLAQMEQDLQRLLSLYLQEFLAFPPFETLAKIGYGPGYTALDALTLYMMVRDLKPKNYIEVGSGLSTYYCSLAAARNASEGSPVRITCIEPYPFEKLYEIKGIEIIAKEVQDVHLDIYQQLNEGDILFIDSSHIVRIDGDVPFLYLEVLPSINAGVVVHIHDVPFPYNTPYPAKEYVFNTTWPMLWNEAMMVQAFLCFNQDFRIDMSTPLIRYYNESLLQKNIPFYQNIQQNPRTFCSIWLSRNRESVIGNQ